MKDYWTKTVTFCRETLWVKPLIAKIILFYSRTIHTGTLDHVQIKDHQEKQGPGKEVKEVSNGVLSVLLQFFVLFIKT